MKRFLLLIALVLSTGFLWAQTPGAGNILYVKKGGTGNGSSWTSPLGELADALRWAGRYKNQFTSTNPLQIWVANGIYYPMYSPIDGDNFKANPTDPRDKTFLMVNNVSLYGGFAGTETAIGQRTNLPSAAGGGSTILSGDIDDVLDVVTGSGSTLSITGNDNNAYHVVLAASYTTALNTSLDGFVIKGGNANAFSSSSVNGNTYVSRGYGGGTYSQSYNDFSTVIISNCNVSGNSSNYPNGSIASYSSFSSSSVKVNNSSVSKNIGGGISHTTPYSDSSVIVNNSSVSGNSAGSGIFSFSPLSSVTVSNSSVSGNSSLTGTGSGIFSNFHSNSSFSTISTITLINTTMANNIGNSFIYFGDNGAGTHNFKAYNSLVFGNYTTATDHINSSIESSYVSITKDIQYSLMQNENSTTKGNLDGTSTSYTTANLFSNFATGDYSLKTGSIGINAGSSTLYTNQGGNLSTDKDLVGNPRWVGSAIDMGAYEYQIKPDAYGILYVKKGSNGNGSSWTNALGEVADALKWAAQNKSLFTTTSPLQIWVAAGTYKPLYRYDNLMGPSTTDRFNSFGLVDHVAVYGGFAGNEILLSQRDLKITANASILSGDLNTAADTDNAYHVVMSNSNTNSSLDGFTIQDGYANDTSLSDLTSIVGKYGAGILNYKSTTAYKNLIVRKNYAEWDGAGLANYFNANSEVKNVLFYNNTSYYKGGAILNFSNASLSIINSTIANNTSQSNGGAIYNLNATSLKLYNSILWGNTTGNINEAADLMSVNSSISVKNNITQVFATGVAGDNNLVGVNPLFVNATTDFRLQNTSPAINKGDNTKFAGAATDKDLAGNARLFNTTIDMGAYEYQLAPDVNNILYVNKNLVGGTGDGSSWANAVKEVADALKWANDNKSQWTTTTPLQIWVAGGMYKPQYRYDTFAGPNTTDRFNSFSLVDHVKLYGGFAGNEILLSQRDLKITANASILSGDLNALTTNTDNAYHVIISKNNNNDTLLDGFTVQDGYANDDAHKTDFNDIIGLYGAGIYNNNSAAQYNNLIIRNNHADWDGGGMINSFNSNVIIKNSLFNGNEASSKGGAIANYQSLAVITNTTLANNKLTTSPADGGAIYTDGNKTLSINNSILWGNTINNASTVATADIYGNNINIKNSITQAYTTNNNADNNLINTDPLFVNAGSDFRLRYNSPAINKGSNTLYGANLSTDKDLAGNPRLVGTTIDMGAYENQVLPLHPDINNILYVNKNVVGGTGDGSSWANAVKEVADALKWAKQVNSFTTANPLKIWVAKGLYKPMYSPIPTDDFTPSPTDPKDKTFLMVDNVKLYGGFVGTEANVSDRIIPEDAITGTILSGDYKDNDIVTGSGSTLAITQTDDNVYHVVVAVSYDGKLDVEIDGFEIKGGAANGTGNIWTGQSVSRSSGGGIYLLTENEISLTLNNSRIYANASSGYGAGVYSSSNASFVSSAAPSIKLQMTNTHVVNNYSKDNGGGIYGRSYANPVGIKTSSCAFTLNRSSVIGNYSPALGGGIYVDATTNSTTGNTEVASLTLNHSRVNGNYAKLSGGGIIVNSSKTSLIEASNSEILSNKADGDGAGITVVVPRSASNSNTIHFNNTTVAGNIGDSYINYIEGQKYFTSYNSVVFGNMTTNNGNSILKGSPTKDIKYSLVQGEASTANGNLDGTSANYTTTNLFTDSVGGNYSLKLGSAAINTGDNTLYTNSGGNLSTDKDIANNPRLYGLKIDMGAYESQVLSLNPDVNNILYVNKNVVGGTGDGSSWANAVKEVADALKWARTNYDANNAIYDTTTLQIYVAKGTYKPLYNAADGQYSTDGGRDNAFVLVKNVQLYGGFDPANGIDNLTKLRIFGDNGSVLSGDLGANDVLGISLDQLGVDASRQDNAYHIVIASANTSGSVTGLDGFSIKQGNANGIGTIKVYNQDFYRDGGGGMSTYGANVNVNQSNFTENSAHSSTNSSTNYSFGGALYAENSTIAITNTRLQKNVVTSAILYIGGGAIYVRNSNLSYRNVNVTGNLLKSLVPNVVYGGGIYNENSVVTVNNATIADNIISSQSISYGGGIYSTGTLKMDNSIIWGNTINNDATIASADLGGNIGILKNSITQIYDTGNTANNNLVGINPLFTNPSAGDYTLLASSPAIDTGSEALYNANGGNAATATDLLGNVRAQGCDIDMGAYERNETGIFAKWNGSAWSNGSGPTQTMNTCINDNYSQAVNFTTKDLRVRKGILNIQPNTSVTVYGNISQTLDNQIVLESDANLVQIPNNAQNDSHKMIAKRGVHMHKMDYSYWGTPVSNQKLLNNTALNDGFSVGTPNNRIYNYNEPDDYFKPTADQYFVAGKAYAIRGKDSFADVSAPFTAYEYQFNGGINNGTYQVQVQKSKNTIVGGVNYEHGFNLIGNPYPSNIDFDAFYHFNNNKNYINAKAWFWTNAAPQINQTGSGYNGNNYATLTLTGGAPPTTSQPNAGLTPTQFIKLSQGFIVQVKDATNTTSPTVTHQLDFDNSMRTDETGRFYNARQTKDRFWLQLTAGNQYTNTILVGYVGQATNQYDGDYDAELMVEGDDALYSVLADKKLQIDGRQYPLNIEDVVPLGTRYADNANYKFSLANKEGIFDGQQSIYLRDKLLNKEVNLSETDYDFYAVKGNENNRFEIIYKPTAVLDTQNVDKSGIKVYKAETDFVVTSKTPMQKVELFDMSGRLLKIVNKTEKEIRIEHGVLPNATYVLKIYRDREVFVRKVIK